MGEHFKKMFAKHGNLTPEEKAKKWVHVDAAVSRSLLTLAGSLRSQCQKTMK
jgi:hypothetical protein